jgi:hypothetical protein
MTSVIPPATFVSPSPRASGTLITWADTWPKPLVVLLAAVALVAAACGGGGPDGGSMTGAVDTPISRPGPGPTFGPSSFPEGTVPDALATDGRFGIVLLLFSEQMPQFLEFMSGPAFHHTLFLPIDEAFEDLPPGTVEALRKEENLSLLFNAFPTHLVDYRLTRKDFETGPLTMAHERHTLRMVVEGDLVTLDDAAVVDTLEAENGIIHAVDAVLGLDPDALE